MLMKQSLISLTDLTRGLVQLLLAWFHSHFWKVDKVSYRVFSENYSPLKEIVAIPRWGDISEENRWQFFRIFKKMISNGELLGCFKIRFYINVVILIGSLYLGFGKLLAMHHC
ncbi:hypothetical protein Godav_029838 [Gossypium davidsonii]|uniref:Uncharacterized protein n=1 Tax=Gossypium davidsonii TaxID=34287 RepID=A0A7J8TGH7_GOSDV|nr:hypothetical protein [Gossypium davidsonii]